ncbi:hypothetical protein PINS_up004576 [Pythium insidiosum]|nr:hypothetical protein PINS_up004576 [Pythium insidiosum]
MASTRPPVHAQTSGKLPLPDDYFRVPSLNAKETRYLVNLAKRACKEVVYYSRRAGGPMNWVHLSSDDGVEVFQGIDESVGGAMGAGGGAGNGNGSADGRSITYLRGATRIYATIDEIADFFRLDTPSKLSGFTQTVGRDLLDQKTLYTLAQPTPENPKHYVGVKWTAVESPSKLARNRDFCYLECHDEFIDTSSKKRGWVRSVHSIRLPFCPPLHKSHGLVRGSLYRSGFVFVESDDRAYVDAIHTLHMDIKGNAPNWLKILVMKRRIRNIAEVNRYFQLQRPVCGAAARRSGAAVQVGRQPMPSVRQQVWAVLAQVDVSEVRQGHLQQLRAPLCAGLRWQGRPQGAHLCDVRGSREPRLRRLGSTAPTTSVAYSCATRGRWPRHASSGL